MGVLNITPDSFYDGGKFNSRDKALWQVEKMLHEGADIIDVGGESTRPGSSPITEAEEIDRVIPVIKEIQKHFDTIISIDTTKPEVANMALQEGASVINDISGLNFDIRIADIAAKYGAGLVLMHTPTRPGDMQNHTHYKSIIDDISSYLAASINKAEDRGVSPESIIIDPGFGFGKTVTQNLVLLKELCEFTKLGKPLLIGTSNKSFIGKVLDNEVDERIFGTAATVALGILNGASIVRAHNVLEMKHVSKVIDAVMNVN